MTVRIFPGRIVRWIDGDTVIVDIDLGFYSWLHDKELRLDGFDCAESRAYVGHPAEEKKVGLITKRWVEKLFPPGSFILIESAHQRHGKYGRIIGDFTREGISWSSWLQESGLVIPESLPQVEKNRRWKEMHAKIKDSGVPI